jgi:chitinase
MKDSCKVLSAISLMLILPLLMLGCKARKIATQPAASTIKAPANFKVVGYLLSGEIANGKASHFDVSKLTYLNIFFNGTDTSGKFKHLPHLDSTIAAAHKNHVIVLGTIGNAINMKFITDSSRAKFIDSLLSSLHELNLDGIDVDLEGDHIDKDYEGFIGALSAALKAQGKLMTAAIATWESAQLTDKALTYFDFLNIMTYDATGPWNLKQPGPHSPYSMAVSDMDFWTKTRGIAKERLTLGLPFYGYGFGPDIQREFHYSQIVNTYPGAEKLDTVMVTPGNIIYYNGMPTIKQKTAFALQNAGGVMMWELMEDADGDKSLLKVVDEVVGIGK